MKIFKKLKDAIFRRKTIHVRKPYLIQIGLDFGTAFTKIVCRDIFIDSCWIHFPKDPHDNESSFLISSLLKLEGENLSHPSNSDASYVSDSLTHMKMSLSYIGQNKMDSPTLKPYLQKKPDGMSLERFVECCAVYLLGGIIGDVRLKIAKRFEGKVEGDQVMVNMAVPVASMNDGEVEKLFERILQCSLSLSDELAGHPKISIHEIDRLIRETPCQDATKKLCFIYPEASANVQSFIRSRASQPGLYLFSDTGAGTVDQSCFLFIRDNGGERLIYLSAQVLEDVGSNLIEKLALPSSIKDNPDESVISRELDRYRELKERGAENDMLNKSRNKIGERLGEKTKQTIALSKQKLPHRDQINQLKVIFGGGGHCENPYKKCVMKQFKTDIFRQDKIEERQKNEIDFDRGMPDLSKALSLNSDRKDWSRRLSVAYGLSFIKCDLSNYKFPEEIPVEKPIKQTSPTVQAPTKDDC